MKFILTLLFFWSFVFYPCLKPAHCDAPKFSPASLVALSTTLGEQKKFVKGFPIILKLTYRFKTEEVPSVPAKNAPWRAIVPLTTLFSDFANIKVVFVNQTTNSQYPVTATRGFYTTLNGTMGAIGAQGLYYHQISSDDPQTMLLNLGNLSAEMGQGLTVMDLPAGDYKVQVVWNETNQKPIELPLTIIDPSDEEKAFLDQFPEDVKSPYKYREVSWGDVILFSKNLDEKTSLLSDVSQLSQVAQQQLEFHKFLLKVKNASDVPANRVALSALPVPAYLQVDKECILLEREIADLLMKGQPESADLQQQVETFLGKHPSLTWRINEVRKLRSEIVDFLVPPRKRNQR